ncbi:DUF1007 family protein [Devosia algicola]|uniref:DUF1007 family protein n=1 Tax=Devosia algicola TaxID=3026418 RepID=A0ABY7YSN5_9HYPH|nr:DUF1007 family protein [Devosia algicola]WDR04060.1 DUF1007 family protein [Devosia algicola]
MALVVAALCAVMPAIAHPHIFIDAKLVVIFSDAGAVSQLRHIWTFDEAFSAWAVQGLDTNGDGDVSPEEPASAGRRQYQGFE